MTPQDVYRLIAVKGQTVTLTRRAAGSYDPATASAAITTSTQTGKGVILPFSAGLRKMAGTNIPSGAVQCLLSVIKTDGAALVEPKVDDTLTDANARIYTIADVARLDPDGTAMLYELELRGNA